MKNVGGIDKILRIIAGVILIASVFVVPVMNPWGWVGLVPLLTALFNFCPLYTLLGISSCKDCKEA